MSTDCSQRPKLNILFLRLAIEVRFVHVTCGTYTIDSAESTDLFNGELKLKSL